jgi:glutamate-1-semialdehyde 2,1-aminomutase
MDLGPATLVLTPAGAIALGVALWAAKARLALSLAKHPSLTGHARMARRFAALVPYYAYDDAHVLVCDGPPEEVAARRRAGFLRLAALFREHFAITRAATAEAAEGISDLQFTAAYRVPFQFSRFVQAHLAAGSFVQSSAGLTVTDLDGNHLYDLTGSYGVNLFGYDFYK